MRDDLAGDDRGGDALAGDDLVGDDDAHRAGVRWATRVRALELGLVGYARNYADGRVLVTAEGPGEAVEALRAWLRSAGTPGTVTTVVDSLSAARGGYSGFDRR